MTPPLDIERPADLVAYLRDAGHLAPGESPRVTVLAGGVSNRTVLVERETGEAWVLKQALAKLRVAIDWFSDPARIEREAAGLRHLPRLAPRGAITPLVFEDPANHLLAMQAVPTPHENWKSMLLAGRVEPDHVEQFADLLSAVHRHAWAANEDANIAAGDSPLSKLFDDRSYFESLRVEPYYAYTASVVPESAGFYEALIASTRSRRLTLVHGDYSPKNVLVHAGRLVLLDHEVIHWGDPAFDVGFAMTHLLSKANHVADARETFRSAAQTFWRVYVAGLTGIPWAAEVEPLAVRHTLGCLLARVAGRSPLEYLTADEKRRQREKAVAMMRREPAGMGALIEAFA